MSNREEILDLLAKGKISVDEAAEALNQAVTDPISPPPPPEMETEAPGEPAKPARVADLKANGKKPSWFRVRVRNLETGQNKVTVNIPLRMLNLGLKLGRRFSPELEGLDYETLSGMMADMDSGMLVEVQDEESNEHVLVYVD